MQSPSSQMMSSANQFDDVTHPREILVALEFVKHDWPAVRAEFLPYTCFRTLTVERDDNTVEETAQGVYQGCLASIFRPRNKNMRSPFQCTAISPLRQATQTEDMRRLGT